MSIMTERNSPEAVFKTQLWNMEMEGLRVSPEGQVCARDRLGAQLASGKVDADLEEAKRFEVEVIERFGSHSISSDMLPTLEELRRELCPKSEPERES